MILSISQYIEALTNNDGRLRTLKRLRMVCDDGEPVFAMPGHGFVDFEVMTDDRRLTLRCPLRYDSESSSRLRAMGERDKGLGGRFFTEWSLLEKEVLLFCAGNGKEIAVEVDILARPTPEGEPLADFLQRAAAGNDGEAVSVLERSFEEMCEWADRAGRSGVVMKRLLVAADGAVSVTAFSANDERERIAETIHAATGNEPPAGYDMRGEREIRCVRDGGGWMYVDRLGRHVIDTVWVAAAPFREGRAEIETRTGKGLIDRDGRAVLAPVYEEVVWDDCWGVAAVMVEGRWSLANRNGIILTTRPYEWLGECSEGMVLAVREGKCGFVNVEGGEIIPCTYDDASSFSEGCAVVSLSGESFLIDARGERI